MPVKIAKKGPTDPQSGVIHISDVHHLLTDFRNKVTVDCSDPSRSPVQKRFYFDIKFKRLRKIIGCNDDKPDYDEKFVRINLSLNLSGQLNCSQDESIENSLSILVCGVQVDVKTKAKTPLLGDGNLILVEGFRDFDSHDAGGEEECCVQGQPFLGK